MPAGQPAGFFIWACADLRKNFYLPGKSTTYNHCGQAANPALLDPCAKFKS
jgi:hypothetical protein